MDCYVKVEEEGRRRLRRPQGKGRPSPFLLLMDREEWKQRRGDYLKGEEPLGGRGPSRCCKVEWVDDCLTGMLRVPEMEKTGAFRLAMGFCLLPDRLVLIGEEGDVKGWVEGRLPSLRQLQSPEHLLRELLEGLLGEDLLSLSRLEEKLEELEGSMEKADPDVFFGSWPGTGASCPGWGPIVPSLPPQESNSRRAVRRSCGKNSSPTPSGFRIMWDC